MQFSNSCAKPHNYRLLKRAHPAAQLDILRLKLVKTCQHEGAMQRQTNKGGERSHVCRKQRDKEGMKRDVFHLLPSGNRRWSADSRRALRPSFARWEVIRRIGIDCRSALGGGSNRHSGIVTSRGAGGWTLFSGGYRLPFTFHELTNLIRRFRPYAATRTQSFQQPAIIDSQHSKSVIADFSFSKKCVDFVKKTCAHDASIHAIACSCNTRNNVRTFFRAHGIK